MSWKKRVADTKARISWDGATATLARAPLTVALTLNSTGDDTGSGRTPPGGLTPLAPLSVLQDVLCRNVSERLRWRQLGQLHDLRWLSTRTIPLWMRRHIRRCMLLLRRWKLQDLHRLWSMHIVLDADVLFRNISERLRWRQLGQLHDMRWLSSWKVSHWMQRHIRR